MHFHNNTVLISPVDNEIVNAIKALGINVVFSVSVDNLIPYERYHADIQLLKIKNRLFLPENTVSLVNDLSLYSNDICFVKPLKKEYPYNVSLNAALIGDRLFCKVDSLAPQVKEYCLHNGINLINVNQGYTKCSTLILNDNAIITGDPSIYKTASSMDIDVLYIENKDYIYLDEHSFGFIGGASGVIGDNVIFFGDISNHPESKKIKDFISKYRMNVISLCTGKLRDIGGFVLLK